MVRVNYEKAVTLITIQNSFFVKLQNIILIFALVRKGFFVFLCFFYSYKSVEKLVKL